MSKDTIIKKVVKIIKDYLGEDYKIFLFGSWAKGDALKTSDIDIGILGKEKAPWHLMAKILEETEGITTLRKIDIVDLRTKEKSFRDNILNYAKSL